MTEILGRVNIKSKPKNIQWFQVDFCAVVAVAFTQQTKKQGREKQKRNLGVKKYSRYVYQL